MEHPLRGVRFSALTAPGPSGTRPEHAADCFLTRKRRVVNRLRRAMLRVQKQAEQAELSIHARWLLRTRLVYLEKP
eukprot:4705367-Karenia_brevis.AAC.1